MSQSEHLAANGMVQKQGFVMSRVDPPGQDLPVGQVLMILFNHPRNKP